MSDSPAYRRVRRDWCIYYYGLEDFAEHVGVDLYPERAS